MPSWTAEDIRVCQHEQIAHELSVKKCAIFAEMGLGKSCSTLTAVATLLDSFQAHRVLAIGPLGVMRKTWPDEIADWEHVSWLRYEFLRDAKDGEAENHAHIARVRYWIKKQAKLRVELADAWDDNAKAKELKRELDIASQSLKYGLRSAQSTADIHAINWQNVHWLIHFWGKYWPYDTVVYDESSIGLKNGRKALVWRAMRMIIPFVDRLILLSGTPMPKGLMNMWGQIYLLDGGERLGRNITDYRQTYFNADYMGYKYEPKPGAMESIMEKISDLALVQRSRDYMDLPDTIYHTIPVYMSDRDRALYKKLEREYLVRLMDGKEITADTAASLTQKSLQLASGRVFDENKVVHEVHAVKLDALAEYLDARNDNVLLAAWYQPDVAAIKKRFPHAQILKKRDTALQDKWNRGQVPLMILHPQSGGHGLNIQFGGRRILWFGPIFHTELYQQFNARLAGARAVGQGATFIDHLITVGTVDEHVMAVLRSDGDMQDAALAYLKALLLTNS